MEIDQNALYRNLGELLKVQRKKKHMTQAELAVACGLLRTTINNIEAGRQGSPFHVLYKICLALNISIDKITPDIINEMPIQDSLNLSKKSPGINKIIDDFSRKASKINNK